MNAFRQIRTLCLAGALAGAAVSGALAETKILYGSYTSPSSVFIHSGFVPWFEEIGRLTNGSITYEIASGGSIVNDKTSLVGLRDGLVDGAVVPSLYHGTELPYSSILTGLGLLAESPMAAAAAATETTLFNCPQCLAEQKEWNFISFGGYSTSAYQLMCTKPISSLADIQGVKIRTATTHARLAAALGATAVNLTINETLEGLQRGQVECSWGPANNLDIYSLGDVAKYTTMVNTGTSIGNALLALNLDKWGELTAEEKKAFVDAAPIAIARHTFAASETDAKALAKAGEKGYTIIRDVPELRAAIDQNLEDEVKIVADQAKGRGIADPQPVIDAFRAALDKWQGILEETKGDEQAFIAAMRREIYDKYPMD